MVARMRVRCALVLTLVGCSAACGVEPPYAEPDPFAGAPRLEYEFVPLEERIGRVGWEPDLIIDERGDELEYALGQAVPRVTVAEDGRIWVLDTSGFRVQVFEPDGDFAFSFGSRGQGPCELDFPTRTNRNRPAFTLAGDSLYILNRPQRISVWDSAGNCTAELNAELLRASYYAVQFAGFATGKLVAMHRFEDENASNGVGEGVSLLERDGDAFVGAQSYMSKTFAAERMAVVVAPPDTVYVAHRDLNRTTQRLVAFDIDGGARWVAEMPWPRTLMGGAKLAVDAHGHVYLFLGNIVEREGEPPVQLLDIFDAGGERLRATTIAAVPVERIWQATDDEFQYGIDQHPETAEWRVVRWRLLEDFQ